MQCPLYPQKQTCAAQLSMSAKCQKRTLNSALANSGDHTDMQSQHIAWLRAFLLSVGVPRDVWQRLAQLFSTVGC